MVGTWVGTWRVVGREGAERQGERHGMHCRLAPGCGRCQPAGSASNESGGEEGRLWKGQVGMGERGAGGGVAGNAGCDDGGVVGCGINIGEGGINSGEGGDGVVVLIVEGAIAADNGAEVAVLVMRVVMRVVL